MTSLADDIVELALGKNPELFHDSDNNAFISIPRDNHKETWPLSSKTAKHWISHLAHAGVGRTPPKATIEAVLSALSGHAQFDGPRLETHLRTAVHDEKYYLDLGNDHWDVIEIDARGWRVVPNCPVRFRRSDRTRALPQPREAGQLDDLWAFVNIPDPEDQLLVKTWMLEVFRPDTPYPILELTGEQGSAKSTTQQFLRTLTDPNAVDLRSSPRTIEQLFVNAANNHLVSLNNVSYLSKDIQDAMCNVSTGGGTCSRRLYTDGEEAAWDVTRPIVINGITPLAKSPDLIDRTLGLTLLRLNSKYRRMQALQADFEAALPAIFGGLLDLFVLALRELPNVNLTDLPRMADFAALGEAVRRVSGYSEPFVGIYLNRRHAAITASLDASPVAVAVQQLLHAESGGPVSGTIQHLLERLSEYHHPGDQPWPHSARGLSDQFRRYAPALREIGIDVEFHPQRRRDGYHVTIKRLPIHTQRSQSSPSGSEHGEPGEHEDRETFVA